MTTRSMVTALLLAGVLAGGVASSAQAADLTPVSAAPDAIDRLTTRSPWQIRVRALGVITRDDGSIDGAAGSDLAYSDTVVPELDITYFFTDNLAA